jgi:hypothetical protein
MNDSIDELSRLKVAKIAPTETPLIENVIHNTALAFELSAANSLAGRQSAGISRHSFSI